MSYLCVKIERYWNEESTRLFSKAAIFLLDTYDAAVIDYARGGLAYTAALLITSPITENYEDGLEMLRMMTEIDDKRMVTFLLDCKEINQTRVWERLCSEDTIVRSPNRQVRDHYQAIIHNLLAVGEQEHVEQLCLHFEARYEDILQMFLEELEANEED
jgi:hypothetical protein